MGLFITLAKPTAPMKKEAASASEAVMSGQAWNTARTASSGLSLVVLTRSLSIGEGLPDDVL